MNDIHEQDIVNLHVRVPTAKLLVRVRGDGRPVVLLHGGGPGTSSCDWMDCMAVMPAGLQCYALDFPGFGGSDPLPQGEEYGGPAFAQAAAECLETLGLGPVTLVGHSMGAAVAATLALQRPDLVGHLVLVSPGGAFYGLTGYHSAGMGEIARAVEQPDEERLRALVALMCDQQRGQAGQVERRLRTLANPVVIEVQRTMHSKRAAASPAAAEERAAMGRRMREYAGPVTLVAGLAERFNPVELAERIRERLPAHAGYHAIPDAGHNVQCDQPEVTARILADAAFAGAWRDLPAPSL
ncbi:4,5:9,10-diseco-3-hydroxy-5,9, 17-trioxoandrosta-1(10),2-diene-4-oate hydrolase [Pigmentiphaga humi]|uniref:4,5:9,10-diseco-3-hydroxy-5,9, 17-trioxoandrosta-1(10),2-diene-4-oate hydrolase n=1 Tax=Pigmentiphaga humi TaxID=2478468 RepID=A0A3P4B399_9BURK|nr:alpha/beta hydrolase [Pigmentiphaga humi]VCU70777.1 4,5:9,10-diseco-3-hydroxy-5,9, 17-trioxoandrosta-1(10),2-diene-4-oate hydrolase [Pigmentiphaga humi]